MNEIIQLFSIPSDDKFLVVLTTFFMVALHYTYRRGVSSGFRDGVELGLDAVEEALELDQEAQDELYEKMAENIVYRVTVVQEEE
tara:strand:- start:616 stop:870 length:255 start_codon:yes stop_codon:yes gene_type:complete